MSAVAHLIFSAALLIMIFYLMVEGSMTPNQIQSKINSQVLMNSLHKQIKAKEQELQNAETINKSFEKMIQLVNILGQVDTFLTERTKAVIKKLALLVDDNVSRNEDSSEEDDD